MVLATALFASIFWLTGCGTTQDVTSYVSPTSGRRTDILGDNLIDAPGETREMLWLNAYRDFVDRHRFKYYLEVIYGAREDVGYLDIAPGRNFTIVADGQELQFSGLGSLTRKEEEGALFETARYDATSEDINAIARAKNVTVRLKGVRGEIIRQFAPENSEKFRKFADQTGADL